VPENLGERSRRVLVAGPNLTIDRTLATSELRPGHDVDVADVTVTAGGKGVNVARAVGALGLDATLLGLLAGHMGKAAAGLLAEERIRLLGLPVTGELRSAFIIHERDGRATVLNEPGPELAEAEWLAYEAMAADALGEHAVVVCIGSLPPGAPDDAYARIVAMARERGRRSVVDAGGHVLLRALDEAPDIVCPNLAEAEAVLFGATSEAVDAPADARERAVAAARALVRGGARTAAVTAASAGAAFADAGGRQVHWVAAPRVSVANPMGAGDAFAAGLATAIARELPPAEAARFAVAVASASVEHPRAGFLDAFRAEALIRAVRVEPGAV
jgi:1-phosphofructokinase family hexose kinase